MKTNLGTLIAVCSVVVMIAAFAFANAGTQDDAGLRQAKWQHLALTHNGPRVSGEGELSRQIEKLGDEGWELVDVSAIVRNGTTEQTVLYFKRPR